MTDTKYILAVDKQVPHAVSIPPDNKQMKSGDRWNQITKITGDNKLRPIIDINNTDTEYFLHPGGTTNKTRDTRQILDKKNYNFEEILGKINGKLIYVKSGSTGHTFRGESVIDNVPIQYAVKVVAYQKKEHYGKIYDIQRPENAEQKMIRLLSYFVVNNQTPHIVLPISTFYTKIDPFLKYIDDGTIDKNNKNYKRFIEKYDKGDYYKNVSLLISEWANRGDLLDFLKKNYKNLTLMQWKTLFFQIISVLAVIQSKFPSFRHNDMKANNILVHRIEMIRKNFKYTIEGETYVIPNIGYIIKLWDFDFACIPGEVDNAKVSAEWTDNINVKPVMNRYYDMHYFFNTLIRKGFLSEIIEDVSVPVEIKEFINRIVPPHYQTSKNVSDRGRILINEEYTIPNEVLRIDPFFKIFRDNAKKYSNSL